MSKYDENDKKTYSEGVILTNRFSHGRITIEDSDDVISVYNGVLEIETNSPSERDSSSRISIIVRGGKWKTEKKLRNPKNAATFRFTEQLSLNLKPE